MKTLICPKCGREQEILKEYAVEDWTYHIEVEDSGEINYDGESTPCSSDVIAYACPECGHEEKSIHRFIGEEPPSESSYEFPDLIEVKLLVEEPPYTIIHHLNAKDDLEDIDKPATGKQLRQA